MLNVKDYEALNNIFGDDIATVETLATDYMGSCLSLDEAIAEVADNAVPVYSCELFKCCAELDTWVYESRQQGVFPENFTGLEDILSVGAYVYYDELLRTNVEAVVFNYAVEYIKCYHENHYDELEDYTIEEVDRKSTRLNSSHANISYAVFCLIKRKILKLSCSGSNQSLQVM